MRYRPRDSGPAPLPRRRGPAVIATPYAALAPAVHATPRSLYLSALSRRRRGAHPVQMYSIRPMRRPSSSSAFALLRWPAVRL